jgi:hypothetical protein
MIPTKSKAKDVLVLVSKVEREEGKGGHNSAEEGSEKHNHVRLVPHSRAHAV